MPGNCSRQTVSDLGQGINHGTYLHGPNPEGLPISKLDTHINAYRKAGPLFIS